MELIFPIILVPNAFIFNNTSDEKGLFVTGLTAQVNFDKSGFTGYNANSNGKGVNCEEKAKTSVQHCNFSNCDWSIYARRGGKVDVSYSTSRAGEKKAMAALHGSILLAHNVVYFQGL